MTYFLPHTSNHKSSRCSCSAAPVVRSSTNEGANFPAKCTRVLLKESLFFLYGIVRSIM
ncbi:hypothetical protein Hanom_Chr03g00190091 [Helianthus anomalus]